jgi:mono/diheme cytochrome c family protein
MRRSLPLTAAFAIAVSAFSLPAAAPAAEPVQYEQQIKPLLQKHCTGCHGADEEESGLRLDFGSLLAKGGDRGPSVVPGQPDKSPLYSALLGKGGIKQMPLNEPKLPDDQIKLIRLWIEQGAKFPDTDKPDVEPRRQSAHWAFQPITRPALPAVKQSGWPLNPIDFFVLKRLETEGLTPSSESDRPTLIRRLHLDLLGVLPTPDEISRFVNDASPDAYEQLVERVLASPRYGERWGRHWLDIARYADSHGFTIDGPRSIWPYRDWVINAINADLPFDQFATEQLAGDLLPGATRDQIVATGFHRNTLVNQEGGTDQEQFRNEAVVDRVNTTGAAFLGLTIGCAQCHVHKYDPITQREYYQLFALFNNCDEPQLPLPDEQQAREQTRIRSELAALEKQLKEHDAARAAGQTDWEKQAAARPRPEWKPLKPLTAVSQGGALINPLGPDMLLVGGNGVVPPTDVYTVTAEIPAGTTITALRLEVFTNPSLPMNGPGYGDDGSFVLSELELTATPAGPADAKGTPIRFVAAETDWQQDGQPVAHAIDGNPKTGWGIGGLKKGKVNSEREAVFVLKEPFQASAPQTLTFLLKQQHSVPKSLLGVFRLSVADAEMKETPVPVALQKILDRPAAERDDAQKELLTAAYGRTDVSRRPLEERQTKLKAEERELTAAIPTTLVFSERVKNPRQTHIHIRGNFLDHGALVQPDVPSVLPALRTTHDGAASRLDFSRWLFDPEHPLTSRVTVNRDWQHLFGLGLVDTENDFGTQGSPPSHPELLDWLASEFMRRDWSRKALHRLIVSSATYRQSSAVTPEHLEKDPRNRLLARQNRLRLEAEGIRDVALAASGLLSQKMLGPGVYPPQPAGIYIVTQVAKQWPESTGDDRYRRGLYTYFWRSIPYPMLPTFDAPDANSTCTRRSRSNTPLQSLTLANDSAFLELARGFSDRILSQASEYDEARLRFAVQASLARDPSPQELARLTEFLKAQREQFEKDPAAAKSVASPTRPAGVDEPTSATWTAVARVLINLDEFITRE